MACPQKMLVLLQTSTHHNGFGMVGGYAPWLWIYRRWIYHCHSKEVNPCTRTAEHPDGNTFVGPLGNACTSATLQQNLTAGDAKWIGIATPYGCGNHKAICLTGINLGGTRQYSLRVTIPVILGHRHFRGDTDGETTRTAAKIARMADCYPFKKADGKFNLLFGEISSSIL